MKLFKLIASKSGQVVFDDRIEAPSPREAREQMKALLGLHSLTGVVYAITEIPVDLIQSIVDARLAESMQRVRNGEPPASVEALIRPLASAAVRELTKRGEQEARDMVTILQEQKKRIAETLLEWKAREEALKAPKGPTQVPLFSPEEQQQLAADRRYQERRLQDLDTELVTEPERIHAGYVVKARRIEPVGIVYLWPRTG